MVLVIVSSQIPAPGCGILRSDDEALGPAYRVAVEPACLAGDPEHLDGPELARHCDCGRRGDWMVPAPNRPPRIMSIGITHTRTNSSVASDAMYDMVQ